MMIPGETTTLLKLAAGAAFRFPNEPSRFVAVETSDLAAPRDGMSRYIDERFEVREGNDEALVVYVGDARIRA